MREAIPDDVPTLAALYAAAVRAAGPARYTPAQIEAWAGFADEPAFRRFVLGPHTFVVEDDAGLAGFAGVERSGRIASLYVHPDRFGRGVASLLMNALLAYAESEGLSPLWSEASAFSLPVFERFGFRLREVERVERRGAEFERFIVERGG